MGISLIPNQPVTFDEDVDSCAFPNNTEYKQLVNAGDKTQFQVKLSPCNDAAEYLNDPEMETPAEWTLGAGWSIGSGQLCRAAAVFGTATATGAIATATLGIYQIEIYVATISGTFYIKLGAITFGSVSAPGAYTFIGFHPGSPTFVTIEATDPDDTICIDNMSVKKIPAPVVKLIDSITGTLIQTWHGDDIANNTYFYPDGEFTFSENSMTFTLDWNLYSVAEGCYYLCLIDPCDDTNGQNSENLINNGDFAAAGANWTFTPIGAGASIDYSGGDAEFLGADTESGTLENSAATVDGICYDIEFMVSVCTLGRVRVECGPFLGTWRTAAGTYTEQFTSDGSAIVFRFENTGAGAHQINIDNIVMTVCDSSLICSYDSNGFQYGSFSCTHLINVCNNENGMGFVFGSSGFSPRIRLLSKFVRASYNAERDQFENSSGKRSVQYFKRRKSKELRIDPQPEYVHDFLSTLMGYDHVYMGSQEYFVDDDEYTPQYATRNDVMASVIIRMSEKLQLVENTNCGADDADCTLESAELLGTSDGYTLADAQGNCIGIKRG